MVRLEHFFFVVIIIIIIIFLISNHLHPLFILAIHFHYFILIFSLNDFFIFFLLRGIRML
jgi:hypothetical protein